MCSYKEGHKVRIHGGSVNKKIRIMFHNLRIAAVELDAQYKIQYKCKVH